MKKIIFIIIGSLLTISVGSFAASDYNRMKADADLAYSKSDYTTAIRLYETILKDGESAEVYYNLGNSYYKHNEIARAILNYERALLLEPYNDDIRNNLEVARSKTLDKADPTPEIFFVTWVKALINLLSVDRWAKTGIIFFLLFIASFSLYIFSKRIALKKTGFVAGIILLAFTICANIFAYKQKYELVNRNTAIVMSHDIIVRSTPSDTGTKLFEIHEGHKVTIEDNSMQDWKEVEIEDGKVGWVHRSDIEVI